MSSTTLSEFFRHATWNQIYTILIEWSKTTDCAVSIRNNKKTGTSIQIEESSKFISYIHSMSSSQILFRQWIYQSKRGEQSWAVIDHSHNDRDVLTFYQRNKQYHKPMTRYIRTVKISRNQR